jgi:hypothetical protein
MVNTDDVPPVPEEKVPVAYRSRISYTKTRRLVYPVQIGNRIGYISKEKYNEYMAWNTDGIPIQKTVTTSKTPNTSHTSILKTSTNTTTKTKKSKTDNEDVFKLEEEDEPPTEEEDLNLLINANIKALIGNAWYQRADIEEHKRHHDSFNLYMDIFSKKQALSSIIPSQQLDILQMSIAKIQGFVLKEGDFLYVTKMTIFMLYFAIIVYLNVTNANVTTHSALFNIVVPLLSPEFG